MNIIFNGKIIMEEEILENKAILYDSKIRKIIDEKEVGKYKEAKKINANGNYISPGFIDIHIHGAGNSDTMDGNIEAIKKISETIVKTGVTSFLPTTMTMSKEVITKAVESVRKSKGKMIGARILGVNLEGPFISLAKKGAQNEKFIVKPNYDFIKEYLDIAKIITLAPEEDGGYRFIKEMQKHKDVVLSIGHSNSNYETAIGAIKAGMKHITHFFNAMTPLHHREPGIVGAAFNSNVTCEVIADKIHINPANYKTIIKMMGKENIILITDSMRAGGLQPGEYDLGGQKVIVDEKTARLEDGRLAGSILKLNEAVKNILENTELSIVDVIKMASLNPARVINIDDKKGSLELNKDADILIFDENIEIKRVIIQGESLDLK